MKPLSKTLWFFVLCLTLSSCVTTREQLNEERGVGEERSALETPKAVQAEELTPSAQKPVTVPMAIPQATAQATTQATTLATPTPAPQTQMPSPPLAIAASPTPFNVQTPYALTTPTPEPSPAGTPILKSDIASYGMDELRAELARVAGVAEELQHEKVLREQTQSDELKKAQDRIAALEKQLKDLTPDMPKLPEGKSPFEAGKDSFSNNNFDEAIVYFTQVLAASDTGKMAEEATFLRGECFFKKQQYNKAIVDYSHFPEKYQRSAFHPKALLKIAESFEAMGRKDDAKAFYSDLLEKFPKTAEGKIAKKRTKSKS